MKGTLKNAGTRVYLFLTRSLKIKFHASTQIFVPMPPLGVEFSKTPSLVSVYFIKGLYWSNYMCLVSIVYARWWWISQSIRTFHLISIHDYWLFEYGRYTSILKTKIHLKTTSGSYIFRQISREVSTRSRDGSRFCKNTILNRDLRWEAEASNLS